MAKLRVEMDRPCVKPGIAFEQRDGGRFCFSCEEMQHDLRDATEKEALALIDANGGRICGTFRAGPGGELRFRADSPSPIGRAARGAVLALALAGCGRPSESTSAEPSAQAPPPSDPPAPPPTSLASPPSGAVAPDSSVLLTDASADPQDHVGHAHNHAPVPVVGIDGISGASMVSHVSGGATARPVLEPTPRVRVDGAHIAQHGGSPLDRRLLIRALATRMSAVRACYGRELASVPTLSGEIAFTMTISESGEVSNVAVSRDTMNSVAVAACAVRVLGAMHVHGVIGADATLTVPLVFDPPQDAIGGL
jgi:hypothetical protein